MNVIDTSLQLPQLRQRYWYVRGNMQTYTFVTYETVWNASMFDLMRLAKGNVYLNQDEADEVCAMLSSCLEELKKESVIQGQHKGRKIRIQL